MGIKIGIEKVIKNLINHYTNTNNFEINEKVIENEIEKTIGKIDLQKYMESYYSSDPVLSILKEELLKVNEINEEKLKLNLKVIYLLAILGYLFQDVIYRKVVNKNNFIKIDVKNRNTIKIENKEFNPKIVDELIEKIKEKINNNKISFLGTLKILNSIKEYALIIEYLLQQLKEIKNKDEKKLEKLELKLKELTEKYTTEKYKQFLSQYMETIKLLEEIKNEKSLKDFWENEDDFIILDIFQVLIKIIYEIKKIIFKIIDNPTNKEKLLINYEIITPYTLFDISINLYNSIATKSLTDIIFALLYNPKNEKESLIILKILYDIDLVKDNEKIKLLITTKLFDIVFEKIKVEKDNNFDEIIPKILNVLFGVLIDGKYKETKLLIERIEKNERKWGDSEEIRKLIKSKFNPISIEFNYKHILTIENFLTKDYNNLIFINPQNKEKIEKIFQKYYPVEYYYKHIYNNPKVIKINRKFLKEKKERIKLFIEIFKHIYSGINIDVIHSTKNDLFSQYIYNLLDNVFLQFSTNICKNNKLKKIVYSDTGISITIDNNQRYINNLPNFDFNFEISNSNNLLTTLLEIINHYIYITENNEYSKEFKVKKIIEKHINWKNLKNSIISLNRKTNIEKNTKLVYQILLEYTNKQPFKDVEHIDFEEKEKNEWITTSILNDYYDEIYENEEEIENNNDKNEINLDHKHIEKIKYEILKLLNESNFINDLQKELNILISAFWNIIKNNIYTIQIKTNYGIDPSFVPILGQNLLIDFIIFNPNNKELKFQIIDKLLSLENKIISLKNDILNILYFIIILFSLFNIPQKHIKQLISIFSKIY